MACAIGWECGTGALAREIQRSLPASPDSRGRLSPPDLFMLFAERFDLYIHSRGQIQLHQRVHRLLRRLENIEEALVGADFELLARFLVDVRRTQHACICFSSWATESDPRSAPRCVWPCPQFLRSTDRECDSRKLSAGCEFSLFLSLFHLANPSRRFRKERTGGKLQAALYTLTAHNLSNRSCADRVPAFANREPQAFFHRNRRDQLDHQ